MLEELVRVVAQVANGRERPDARDAKPPRLGFELLPPGALAVPQEAV